MARKHAWRRKVEERSRRIRRGRGRRARGRPANRHRGHQAISAFTRGDFETGRTNCVPICSLNLKVSLCYHKSRCVRYNDIREHLLTKSRTYHVHVAHGKSTVVKAISGVMTVRFKNELVRNITIKLEYANAKVRCSSA